MTPDDHRSDAMDRDHSRDKEDVLEEMLAEYIDRLNRGEILDEQQLLVEQPVIGGEIWERLEVFETVGARVPADHPLGTLGDYTLRRQSRTRRHGRGVRGVGELDGPGGRAEGAACGNRGGLDRAAQRFMQEAKAAGKLRSPECRQRSTRCGVKEQTPYYAMEFVEGETLAQILAETRGR